MSLHMPHTGSAKTGESCIPVPNVDLVTINHMKAIQMVVDSLPRRNAPPLEILCSCGAVARLDVIEDLYHCPDCAGVWRD